MEEDHSYTAEVPQHSTESGFSVSDNVNKHAFKLTMTGIVSAYQIGGQRSETFLDEVKDQFKRLFEDAEPFPTFPGQWLLRDG